MQHPLRLGLACLLLLAPAARVRAEESPGDFPLTVHERTLANGLKVLVIPRKGVPTSPCAIAYEVGSVNERVGQTGMAHYLEHMMFKGTRKTGVKDLAVDQRLRDALDRVMAETIRLEDGIRTPETEARLRALKEERLRLIDEQKQNLEINHLFTIYGDAGSTFTNAMTSNDWTTYIASLPPEKLELFFWIESDRMKNIVFRQFHAEKDVVREERRMYENRPGALFGEEVERAVFGSHPYAHPVLGYHDDLRAMTRAELRAFWSTYYSPDNATLYVGGDVDPERIFALAERYFGSIPPASGEKPRIPMLRIPKSGEIRMRGRGLGRDSVEVHYRTPAGVTEEALALDLIASYLGDPKGPLFEDLVENDKTAVDFGARYDGRRYGGTISLSATLSPTGTHEAAEARILAAVRTLAEQPLPDEALTRLRRRYRADVLGALQSDMRVGFLVLRREMGGSWRDIERDLIRSRTLTADALQEAARTYLVAENSVVTWYTMDEEAGEPAPAPTARPMPAPAAPPPPPASVQPQDVPDSWTDLVYEARDFVLPSGPSARRVLSNGIRAFVVRGEGDPVVRVTAQVLGGEAEDPQGKEGLAELAAGVLGEAGIPGLSPQALQEHLEGIVGSVSAASDLDGHTVGVTVFPADLGEGLRILRLLLTEPELDPKAFERLRDARLARVDAEETRLRGVTSRLYRRLLWGEVPETRRPTRESLGAITLDDVRAYLRTVTGPQRVLLAVSGDLDVDTLVARLDGALGDWKPEGGAAWTPAPTKNDRETAARGLHLRAMPVSQGSVRIGQVTVPRAHEDSAALNLLSSVLSRRIFNTVRSVHGLSYQAGARFTPSWRNDSPFTITFQTKCESVPFAVHLALDEVRTLIAEGPTAAEMAEAKLGLDASFRRTFGRGLSSAEAFAELEVPGRGPRLLRCPPRALRRRDARAGAGGRRALPPTGGSPRPRRGRRRGDAGGRRHASHATRRPRRGDRPRTRRRAARRADDARRRRAGHARRAQGRRRGGDAVAHHPGLPGAAGGGPRARRTAAHAPAPARAGHAVRARGRDRGRDGHGARAARIQHGGRHPAARGPARDGAGGRRVEVRDVRHRAVGDARDLRRRRRLPREGRDPARCHALRPDDHLRRQLGAVAA